MTSETPLERAYKSSAFMGSRHARPLRILAEYLHPESRFEGFRISDMRKFWLVYLAKALIATPPP
jgi:hypothetical protein